MTAPGAGTAARCSGTRTAERPHISTHNYRQAAHNLPGRAEHLLLHAGAPHVARRPSFARRMTSPQANLAFAQTSHRARATAPTSHSSLQAGRNDSQWL